ncbi:NFX1-type zinc finger-containing protein [Fusarium subglutinans]|uniref:NFX1-type zinc finger-containing protein n=1 Tax=Gibberella subglutinans TaxID=42677 RepID=A0A8H5UX91_GIBSU|nr:NFX1-type zinc finger-containing protein [Fusarium subglutinans]KAF5601548.1 NFX1-type zinc finger-containing protein [Fusarium subglutinans]
MASPGNRPGGDVAVKEARKAICKVFQKGFGCRRDCQLIHDPETVYLRQPTTNASARLNQFRASLEVSIDNDSSPCRDPQAALTTWETALDILDSSYPILRQRMAMFLSDRKYGRDFIMVTVTKGSLPNSIGRLVVMKFLEVITHTSLLNDSSIEMTVKAIYSNAIYPPFDQSLENCAGPLYPQLYQYVLCIARAGHELLRRVPQSLSGTKSPSFLEYLDNLVAKVCESFPNDGLEEITRSLYIMKRLAASSKTHLGEEQRKLDSLASALTTIERPGGRHDNDFADISDIAILPTLGEINSESDEYLPSTNFSHPHALRDPLQRHVDSHFRLLRHDAMGPIIEAIRSFCRPDTDITGNFYDKEFDVHMLHGCYVHHISLSPKRGLSAVLPFDTPKHISGMSIQEKEKWWKHSDMLEERKLLCFVPYQKDRKELLFFQASDKIITGKYDCLVSSDKSPRILVHLVTPDRNSLSQLTRLYESKARGFLVQFSSVYTSTLMPMIDRLKRIRLDNHIPLHKWMVPAEHTQNDIPPPLYVRQKGFVFPMGCIAKNKDSGLQLDPYYGFEGISLSDLEAQTGLDNSQCQGLVAALTREYALIQGPPGTGKSHLGVQLVRVLLAVQKQAKLGPLIISCYTNEALDQFLKQLLDAGVDQIVRIGRNNVAPELSDHTLRTRKYRCHDTQFENTRVERLGKDLCGLTSKGPFDALLETDQETKDRGFVDFLSETRPNVHRQLVSEDTIQATTKSFLRAELRDMWPSSTKSIKQSMEELNIRAEKDIHDLSSAEQGALVDHWTEEWRERKVDAAFETVRKLERLCKQRNDVCESVSQRVLAQAQVIGVTTSAAARNSDLLQRVSPKVMIYEEAAEVMEPHLISSIIPGIEHLIQIGDEKQLRPQIANCKLGVDNDSEKKWQLDRSQFERRAAGEPGLSPVPFVQLNVQRRMRPEISQLINSSYPELQDHPSVRDFPNVVGMRRNVFWLDHKKFEGGLRGTSYTTEWEVKMVTRIVRHLVRQGEYKPRDLALLTPYNGQLRQLNHALGEELEISMLGKAGHKVTKKRPLNTALRLATLDKFQGEEAKVVIISMTRHNPRRNTGVVMTANWINVLLSRAKHGMYLIGDFDSYRSDPGWEDVYSKLSSIAAIGNTFDLRCHRHPDAIMQCYRPEHFDLMSPQDIRFAMRFALAPSLPAITGVQRHAMEQLHVGAVNNFAKLDAHTPVAMRFVAHASKIVLGLVLIKGPIRNCGHQCPSFCGEDCPVEYCQECSPKKSEEVDLLEFRTFSEINLDENPIVVLGCGHFFTGETLDGLVGLDEARLRGQEDEYVGWKEVSSCFTTKTPVCPHCKQPIHPHATKRYGRLIKQALKDENHRRFLTEQHDEIQRLEEKLQSVEDDLTTTRSSFLREIQYMSPHRTQERHSVLKELQGMGKTLGARIGQEIQRSAISADAIEASQALTFDSSTDEVQLETSTYMQGVPWKQVALRARLIHIQAQELHLRDGLAISPHQSLASWMESQSFPALPSFLNDFANLIKEANDLKLPRVVISGTLSFAKIARLIYHYEVAQNAHGSNEYMLDIIAAEEQTKIACELLDAALLLCSDLRDGEKLKQKVQDHIELFHTRHEEITPGELASIKSAMVSGTQGMATNSGYWYNCVNGHPFAVGDCGMPTEVARCPECGAPVGGTNHRPLDGVTRAEEMETEEVIVVDATAMEDGGEAVLPPAREEVIEPPTEEPNEPREVAVPEDEAEHQS